MTVAPGVCHKPSSASRCSGLCGDGGGSISDDPGRLLGICGIVVHRYFGGLVLEDRQDIVGEMAYDALRRGFTFKQVGMRLAIDGYRRVMPWPRKWKTPPEFVSIDEPGDPSDPFPVSETLAELPWRDFRCY